MHNVTYFVLVCRCMWFLLEPLITKNENYSFSFYKKMLEKIKQCKDVMCPDNEEANKVWLGLKCIVSDWVRKWIVHKIYEDM